jgi:hypothetical protein
MLKKAFAAIGLAALLTLGGAAAASAGTYPPTVACTAGAATLSVGQSTVITCSSLPPNVTGTITVTGPGVVPDTLSSVVMSAAVGTSSVKKTTTAEGTVSVNFKGPIVPGSYTVTLVADNGQSGATTVTVVDPQASGGSTGGAGGGAGLPVTGGTLPAAAVWLGLGAVGLGGIAVVAAAARRRAHNR